MAKREDDSEIRARFGRRLRDLRLANEFSQEEFALQSGLHRTYVSSAERGERNVSLINLTKLGRALGVPPGELLS